MEPKFVDVEVGQNIVQLPMLTEDEWKDAWCDGRSPSNISEDWDFPEENKDPSRTPTQQRALANICSFMQKVAPPEWLWNDEVPGSQNKPLKQVLIGICGKKNHGKDTIANYFVSNKFTQLAFADPLKESVKALFDLTDEQLHDPKKKEEIDARYGISPRQMFQKLGTFIRDNLSPNFFVDHLMRRGEGLKRVCVSDVRRQNEANAIRERGGIIIKVVRPERADEDGHESETDIQNIKEDFLVCNNGEIIRDLYPKLDRVCDEIVERGLFTREAFGRARWDDEDSSFEEEDTCPDLEGGLRKCEARIDQECVFWEDVSDTAFGVSEQEKYDRTEDCLKSMCENNGFTVDQYMTLMKEYDAGLH